MVINHKCVNCGADMVFDPASGMLTCPSCGSTLNISDMENELGKPEDMDNIVFINEDDGNDPESFTEHEQMEYENENKQYFSEEDARQVKEFHCTNCGATLVTDAKVVSTNCSFCDSPMVLGDRLNGALRPSYVLPFKISKEQAKVEFDKWRKKAWLSPGKFKKTARLRELAGQYVPFWLYILKSKGVFSGIGIVVSHYSRGNYDYTEKKYYNVYRKFNIDMRGIPVDASIKMDDETMDKLEPFDYNELKEFNTPYLAGYLAESYDYDDKELYPRVKERAQKYSIDFVNDSVSRYTSVTNRDMKINITPERTDYVLMPIWMFNYNYEGKDYMFTMNAQTGKVIGKPPISKARVAGFFLSISAIIVFVMRLIYVITGGSLL